MIDPYQFQQNTEAASELLRRKFGVRGRGLETRLRRAGRRLPKAARRAGQDIVQIQPYMSHPKLARLLEETHVTGAFDALHSNLEGINRADRRKGAVLALAGGLVFNLIIVVTVLVLLLRWRGIV